MLAGEIETYAMEKRYLRKSGETVWVNLTVSLVRLATGEPDYFVGVVEDITRRKQAEQALRDSEEQYRTLDLEPLLELTLDHLSRIVDYDSASIWIGEGDSLVIRADRAPEGAPSLVGMPLSLEASPTLHQMIETREAFIVDDLSKHRDLVQVVQASFESPGATETSWLGVPVVAKDQVIGVISLVFKRSGYTSRTVVDQTQALANRAAIAIQNARLHEQVQLAAALEERTRLAQDLHDSVTQGLYSASLIAETLPRAWQEDQEEGRRGLQQLRRFNQGALAEMRTLLLELRPSALAEQELPALLRQLEEAMMSRTQTVVSTTVVGDCSVPTEVKIALYRIAQEALNNVVNHARAHQATVSLHDDGRQITLHISDDGCGFDAQVVHPERMGIGIMHERARAIGATLNITSQPKLGTEILVEWCTSEGESP
jgi:two-component system nitrate/nitrite sensor histidine kinase NarX